MKSKITKFKVQQIIFWPSQFFTEDCQSIFIVVFSVVSLVQISMVSLVAGKVSEYLPGPVSGKYTIKANFINSNIKSEVTKASHA